MPDPCCPVEPAASACCRTGGARSSDFPCPANRSASATAPPRPPWTQPSRSPRWKPSTRSPWSRPSRAGRAPGLARAFRKAQALEQALLLDHVVRLGRQTAYERVAHFLLELQHRLHLSALGDQQRFALPLTQEIMADVLGLSIVHVNRTLQQLRREQLIELRSGVAILLQRDTLVGIAGFKPADGSGAAANA
ncbi:Crp/Fnr family transcriptional regulator [Phenylobacterium sp. J367]|uniref:Crp/Fnr family transcriptional regulator n=1 Tax=Phenylobacterium sp. J367 TaxID=2898435 RepID=UPI002150EB6F|nr:Crp/Fnr family transcriptional regulator [Phenylobacterium sp. J367]MCR5880865.1 Crp/Fnr family transcriptional regulator [Phenylobacterium sp. J367]